jgi:sporulation protein YlmC with PRC-barrel domain
MRASDLLGLDVYDAGGKRIGRVTDLRCVLDGPLRGALCAPRVHALLVSKRRLNSTAGYDRHKQHGPWLIRIIVRGLHHELQVVPWSRVDSYEGRIQLRAEG